MNFYDKVHELVRTFKDTEEYKDYMKKKTLMKQEEEKYKKVKDFRDKQREQQMNMLSGKQMTEEEKQAMQQMYSILMQDTQIVEFFQAEIKLDVILADMQKILSEGIQEIVEF